MTTLSRRGELIAGTALALTLIMIVVIVFKILGGAFSDHVDVTAKIGATGDSLDIGNIVTYREVIVGEVRDFRSDGEGGAVLELRIDPEDARMIPKNVRAVGVPADLFGQTAILLREKAGASSAEGLENGDQVAADESPGAAGLQSALAELYDLAGAISPAELNTAISAIAVALQGNGDQVGELIDATQDLTRQISPSLPELDQVIRKLAVVSTQFAESSPDLLKAAQNLLVPARAITANKAAIERLLTVAPQTLQNATRFTREVGDDFITIVTNSRPVLDALAQNPDGLAGSITGFRSLADAFNSVIRDGRAHLDVYVTGVNAAALAPLFLGDKSQILNSTATPFPSESAPASSVTPDRNSVPGSTVGGPEEVALTQSLVSSISGISNERVPEAVSLLLGPLLRGESTVIR